MVGSSHQRLQEKWRNPPTDSSSMGSSLEPQGKDAHLYHVETPYLIDPSKEVLVSAWWGGEERLTVRHHQSLVHTTHE